MLYTCVMEKLLICIMSWKTNFRKKWNEIDMRAWCAHVHYILYTYNNTHNTKCLMSGKVLNYTVVFKFTFASQSIFYVFYHAENALN